MESPDQIRARHQPLPNNALQAALLEGLISLTERKIVDDILEERTRTRTEAGGGSGAMPTLGVLGVLSLLAGLYYLFVSPGVGGDVVNLQRLAIGATLAIVGGGFIAAQWRPR